MLRATGHARMVTSGSNYKLRLNKLFCIWRLKLTQTAEQRVALRGVNWIWGLTVQVIIAASLLHQCSI